jgi:hypothetical protein
MQSNAGLENATETGTWDTKARWLDIAEAVLLHGFAGFHGLFMA